MRLRSLFAGIVLVLVSLQPALAQAPVDGPWKEIIRQEGVAFSYLYYREADNTNGGIVVRLVNTNDYAVDYRFKIIFRADGDEHIEQVEGELEAGQVKTGDSDGLFWIPFEDGRGIGEVGLRGYKVTPREGERGRK